MTAAVESGADAVYLAGKMFGARAYAANFTNEELSDAILFAHRRGVRVNVAVNTLVDDGELDELAAYLRFLYTAGADAIIVQDLGVAKLAREVAPGLPLHASTQLTVHNLAGAQFMEELGFKRVVLSRELSLADIAMICKASKAEIEVFVHGALCISYSGQCLMSGMIGGRSGNRGRCAQPCRLPYTLVDEEGRDLLAGEDCGAYLLSPKDMNTLLLLPELIKAGVASFKIEGRMKRPEYVAVVTDTYRRRIDACLEGKGEAAPSGGDQKDLAQIFNRDFTTAYLTERPGKRMMSDRRPNNRGVLVGRALKYDPAKGRVTVKLAEGLAAGDTVEFWVKVGGRVNVTIAGMTVKGNKVTCASAGEEATFAVPSPVKEHDRVFKVFDAKLMERARKFFQSGALLKRFPVDITVTAQIGRPLKIAIVDENGLCGEAETAFIVEKALKRPLSPEAIRRQVERLGTTPFSLRSLKCQLDSEVMVPVSEINEARRRAAEMLEEARLEAYRRPPLPGARGGFTLRGARQVSSKGVKPELCVNVDSLPKAKAALAGGADALLFGGDNFKRRPISDAEYREAYEMAKVAGKKFILNTPRILQQWQMDEIKRLLEKMSDLPVDGVSAHNVGTIQIIKQLLGAPIHADISLNIYNSAALAEFLDMGVSSAALSPELNFAQIERIAAAIPCLLECVVHGSLELMVSEYCAMGSYLGGLGSGSCNHPCLNGQYFLKDRKEELFPLVTDQYCRMHVLNGKELCMLPHVAKFAEIGVGRLRIEGKWMDEKAILHWTKLYHGFIAKGEAHPLSAKDKLEQIEPVNKTRGHYFRGVL